MNPPNRVAVYKGGLTPTPRGPLKRPCPECGARPGWRCIKWAYDADGRPYELRRQQRPHAARRNPT